MYYFSSPTIHRYAIGQDVLFHKQYNKEWHLDYANSEYLVGKITDAYCLNNIAFYEIITLDGNVIKDVLETMIYGLDSR